MTPLRIYTTVVAATAVITVVGEIDMDTSPDLAAAVAATLAMPQVTEVVIDLDRVAFLDMVGLGDLIQVSIAASRTGKALRITHPRGTVERVLDITGTRHLLTGEPCMRSEQAWPQAAGF